MRIKRLRIAMSSLLALTEYALTPPHDRRWEIVGLPADAKIIDVRPASYPAFGGAVDVLVSSNSFPEAHEGEEYAELTLVIHERVIA